MSSEKWDRIKRFYDFHHDFIFEAGAGWWGVAPYSWEIDAGVELTPIESMLWYDIRAVGAVLYPQYPVAGYFVDFGNPVAKVAVECDGSMYHLDLERDARRQRAIEARGWTVYRISGRECVKDSRVVEDEYGREKTELSEAYKLIRDIANKHKIRHGDSRPPKENVEKAVVA